MEMRNNKNKSKGITLIALVVTVIVLLILAGISVQMLKGDNGILQMAGYTKTNTEIENEKEIIKIASLAAISKEKYGELTKDKLDNELNNHTEIQNTEQVNKGIVVRFKSGRVYLVDSGGSITRYNEITIGELTVKNGMTEVIDGSKSVQLNTPLTINFKASILEGNITRISPTIPYTTNGTEKSITFTIIGTEGLTKKYTVDLKGYYNIPELKVGDFVNYVLKAPSTEALTQLNSDIATYSGSTNNTTKTAAGSNLLCRILEIDETTGNPTKLISANGVNQLCLNGVNGYNNAVYLINEMCETLYSGNQGTTTSLTIEDLENTFFSDEAIAIRDSYANSITYSETKRYASYAKYPKIALEEEKMGIATKVVGGKNTIRTEGLALSEQTKTYVGSGDANASNVPSANKGITVTQTDYYISNEDSNYKNVILKNIIHNSPTESSNTTSIKQFWLSSRSVTAHTSYADFKVRCIGSNISGKALYDSWTGTANGSNKVGLAIRPIINLNSEIHSEYVKAYNSTYNIFSLY